MPVICFDVDLLWRKWSNIVGVQQCQKNHKIYSILKRQLYGWDIWCCIRGNYGGPRQLPVLAHRAPPPNSVTAFLPMWSESRQRPAVGQRPLLAQALWHNFFLPCLYDIMGTFCCLLLGPAHRLEKALTKLKCSWLHSLPCLSATDMGTSNLFRALFKLKCVFSWKFMYAKSWNWHLRCKENTQVICTLHIYWYSNMITKFINGKYLLAARIILHNKCTSVHVKKQLKR